MSDFEQRLADLAADTVAFERLTQALSRQLGRPKMTTFDVGPAGFRYDNPGIPHFCLLKSARAVSSLNACIDLARGGYTQEIFTLLRVLVECTTHIEYVLGKTLAGGEIKASALEYVMAYFSDSERRGFSIPTKAKVRQELIHKTVADDLNDILRSVDSGEAPDNLAELMSTAYAYLSNFVHARYPETMDLYGGPPSRFHLRGMRGTPRDRDNLDLISTYAVTLSNTLKVMVYGLELQGLVEQDPVTSTWFGRRTLDHENSRDDASTSL